MEKLLKYCFPAAIIFFFAIFLYRNFLIIDLDFGWHLKMGELILNTGIPKTDPFSYTMPSYPFVDHEWLSNILMFLAHKTTGNILLALFVAVLSLASVLLQIDGLRKQWHFVPFLMAATTLASFAVIRTQVITWFFFSLFLWILLNKSKHKRFSYFIPLIMLLWVNLHGGFAIGIVLLAIVFGFRVIESRRFDFNNFVVFLGCIAATFVNPYGYRIWWEVWMQISDWSLKWNIMEWKPAFFSISLFSFWVMLVLSLIFVLYYFRKIPKLSLVLFFIFLVFGISSRRHIPFWVLVAIPVIASGIRTLYNDSRKNNFSQKAFRKTSLIFLISISVIIVVELTLNYFSLNYGPQYPKQAIKFLSMHPSKGEIFSHYNYGGYLIWKLPGKKVFIDGRMPSWCWIAPKNESNYAFVEWKKTVSGEIPFFKTADKYNIDTVLWFPEDKKSKTNPPKALTDFLNNVFHLEKDYGGLVKDLKKSGFMIIYQDDQAVIYRKEWSGS